MTKNKKSNDLNKLRNKGVFSINEGTQIVQDPTYPKPPRPGEKKKK